MPELRPMYVDLAQAALDAGLGVGQTLRSTGATRPEVLAAVDRQAAEARRRELRLLRELRVLIAADLVEAEGSP